MPSTWLRKRLLNWKMNMFHELPTSAITFMSWAWSDIAPYYDDLVSRPIDAAGLAQWLADWTRLSDLVGEAYARLNTAVTVDTTDAEAEGRYNDFLDSIHPRAQAAEQKLKEKLLASGLEPDGFKNPLRKMRAEAAIFRAENLPLLSQERKLASEYNKIIGAQSVTWQDEELTLQQLRRPLQDPDRTVREQVWRLAAERQLADRQQINDLWGRFMDLRRQLVQNAGMADYLAYRWQQMLRLDYSPKDCLEFQQAILQVVVPAATRLYEKYRQRLGVDRLRPWDLDQDLYPLEMPPLPGYGSVADLAAKAEAAFRRVEPQLGDYFQQMRSGDSGMNGGSSLLDLDNRKGKAPGAYCTAYPVTRRPFIFMNAVGIASDVRTILHESGHAFHNYERLRLPYAQQRAPGLEFAEVASMAMELLASPHLDAQPDGFYGSADARRFRIAHLEHILAFWPYMAVVDAFQHWVYMHPAQGAVPANCDAQWLELWQRFLPGVDWDGLDAAAMTGWQRKQHIHRYPLYYVEYGLAQLGAVQVWRNALSDPSQALNQYRHALSLGGTASLPELYRAAGAKFAFGAETLSEAVNLIEDTIHQLELEE
jgi:oligoendopeptidase F